MNLLHLDSSITGANSVSRQLSAAIVAECRKQVPDVHVTYRDLAADPLPAYSSANLQAQHAAPTEPPEMLADLAAATAVMDEFLAADVVLIGAPMYNFAIPGQLKAWIDRICIAGKTFRYTATGPEGLAGGKKVYIASSRGGLYGPGSPYESADHQETHLRSVFGFLGVTDFKVARAEGVAMGEEPRRQAIESAEKTIAGLKVA